MTVKTHIVSKILVSFILVLLAVGWVQAQDHLILLLATGKQNKVNSKATQNELRKFQKKFASVAGQNDFIIYSLDKTHLRVGKEKSYTSFRDDVLNIKILEKERTDYQIQLTLNSRKTDIEKVGRFQLNAVVRLARGKPLLIVQKNLAGVVEQAFYLEVLN